MTSLRLQSALVFFLGFLFTFSLYVGLPYDFSYDLITQYDPINTMSYREIISHIMNPLTPAWFYMPDIGRLRPVYNLIQKSFFDLWGVSLVPNHVAASIGNGILYMVFFLLGSAITQKKIYGWLLALLYASFPTNSTEMTGQLVTALPSWQSMISAGSIACLGLLTYKYWPLSKRVFLFCGWIFLAWFAIKWKSYAKLVPIITFAFLILRFPKINRNLGTKFSVFLIVVNVLMFALVVPLSQKLQTDLPSGASMVSQGQIRKDQQMFRVDFKNILSRMIVLPGQENPLTHVFLREPPSSFTGNLGFFLGWFFWLSLLSLPWILWKIRVKETHFLILNLIYFGLMVGAFASGASVKVVRFLDLALVPAMTLIVFEIRFVHELFNQSKLKQKVLTAIFSLFFIIPIVENLPTLLKWVTHNAGIQHALVETEKTIYRDYYQKEPQGIDIYMKHPELESRITLVTWYELNPNWYEEALGKLAREGVLYVKTRQEEDETIQKFRGDGYHVDKMGAYSFYGASPLMFRLKRWLASHNLIRMKNRQIILYKIL